MKVSLINGKTFTVETKDFVKGTSTTSTTVIRTPTGRNIKLANWYIVSAK